MRIAFASLALFAVACSPSEDVAPAPVAEAPAAYNEEAGMLNVVSDALSADLGLPRVALTSDTIRTDGDWGWVVARPQNVDWTQTKYESAFTNGVFDESGATYALLHRDNGVWTIREMAIGPTDVAYVDWPARHGAPAALFGLE